VIVAAGAVAVVRVVADADLAPHPVVVDVHRLRRGAESEVLLVVHVDRVRLGAVRHRR